jgi:HD-like signal output (HDOD) protein
MAGAFDREELERLLAGAEALPPCPPVLAKVAEVCRDPGSTARDLGNVIATDEALTSRLIRMVNSAYYGLRGTISTVTQAVVILGYREIRNMVYAFRAEDVFSSGREGEGVDPVGLWDHCLQVAVLARELSYRVRYPIPEEVFVSGVVHDIGQVIMNRLLGADYHEFLKDLPAGEADLDAAETDAFGIGHAEVGRRLAERWDFPSPLRLAVAWHHALPESPEGLEGIAPFVFAADRARLARTGGRTVAEIWEGLPGRLTALLRLDAEQLEEAIGRADAEHARIRGSFDLLATEEG